MPSSSRTTYAANTPDRSVFDVPASVPPQVSYKPTPPSSSDAAPVSPYLQKWNGLSRFTRRSREVVENNLGLLRVACAQLFFSLMNVGVKQLNSLDPPVPAVEVSGQLRESNGRDMASRSYRSSADLRANGTSPVLPYRMPTIVRHRTLRSNC